MAKKQSKIGKYKVQTVSDLAYTLQEILSSDSSHIYAESEVAILDYNMSGVCNKFSIQPFYDYKDHKQKVGIFFGLGEYLEPFKTTAKAMEQIEQEEQAELERITKIEKKDKRREVGMARSFESLVEIGRQRGYANPQYWAMCVWNSRELKKLRR